MRLLVSVTCAKEAIAALDGGADFIDAKDPSIGPLGAVSIQVLPQILNAVAGARQVTAALGEATSEEQLERSAAQFSAAGVALIKVGFAGTAETDHVAGLIQAAMRGVRASGDGTCGVIAVAYADAMRAASPAPRVIIDVAARFGAAGVLVDTGHGGLREVRLGDFAGTAAIQARDLKQMEQLQRKVPSARSVSASKRTAPQWHEVFTPLPLTACACGA
jgi:uncharacterized protein (UPF0264 family)